MDLPVFSLRSYCDYDDSFIHSCILQKAVDRTHLYNKTRELVKVQQLKHAITDKMKKKRSERRKHCALAVEGGAKNFRPAADPLSGGTRRPQFN